MNFEHLISLCQQTHEEIQKRAVRAIDLALVVRNWLFGCYIVEFEQNGADRAAYGSSLMDALTERLKPLGIKGVSVTRLRLYRSFYRVYQRIDQAQLDPVDSQVSAAPIQPTASIESSFTIRPTASVELIIEESGQLNLAAFVQTLSSLFALGWSHYVELLTLDDPDERRFYEIEAAANQWTVRELQRQINTSLYQRLALSRNKDEIRRFASQGQVVEKAADLIKNPLVLEFLGLQDRPYYSEEELESAIIDQLETFLLELGKGFLFEARQKRFTFDVLCHRKNEALVELTLPKDANIFASKYQLYLPSKEELKAQVEAITTRLEEAHHRN